MKKLFAALLSLLLITGCFGVCAQQPDYKIIKSELMQTIRYYGNGNNPQKSAGIGSSNISNAVKKAIFNDIYTALKNVQDSVDLSKYNIPYDFETNCSIAQDLLNDVIDLCPDVYFIINYYLMLGQNDDRETYIVTSIVFKDLNYTVIEGGIEVPYPIDPPEYTLEDQTKKLQFCNGETNKIIAGIPKGSNDIQKVVYVHDYLVANYGYDLSRSTHNAYGFLKSKEGVCQSYTHTFKMIMDKLGIECYAAKSSAGREPHIWNIVKIGDCYYHVDCTSDDPVVPDPDSDYYLTNTIKNYVSHENLLVSSQQLAENDGTSAQHADLEIIPSFAEIECSSKRFDNAAYREITSQIFNYDENWYAVTCDLPRNIVKFNSDFTDYTIAATSKSGGSYYYEETDERMTNLLEIGTNVGAYVYFNDPQYVYKYNFLTNEFSKVTVLSKIYSPAFLEATCYARGCYISSDGKLEVFVTYSNDGNAFTDYNNTSFQCYCDGVQLGDLTDDGKIMADDLLEMKNYLLTGQSSIVNFGGLADLTRNNTVDLLDFIKMKRIITEQV